MNKKTISTRRYRAGYEVRREWWDNGDDHPVLMRTAYNPDGEWIGEPSWAHRLCVQRGIRPVKSDPDHCVCSIGYSSKDGKWYGWSHRAIHGFKVGDVVKKGNCTAGEGWTEEYLAAHPEERRALPVGFMAITIDDAKMMAVAFAASVS